MMRRVSKSGAESDRTRVAQPVGRYPWYALVVLATVYMLNFLDRQILSILAEAIKLDLSVSDAQLGFLYGTAFAVFYAVFGIPLARLSDIWIRKNVIAIGLVLWSLMTALSGTARTAMSLGAYRVGVGVGESSATPAAYAMLTDFFPERLRATALSLYTGGLYVGQGLGAFLGGYILDRWDVAFPGGDGWFGLRGWQAAFFIVGLPGLLVAVWVYSLREPVRGAQEGATESKTVDQPLKALLDELASVIPPFAVIGLHRAGASSRVIAANLGIAAGLAAAAALLVHFIGSPEQWIALAIGLYATASWIQGLAIRDRPVYVMLFRSTAIRQVAVGVAAASFVTYAYMFWTAPYLLRTYDVSATEVGFWILVGNLGGGIVGVLGGGLLSDKLKQSQPAGRLYVILSALLLHFPAALMLLLAPSIEVAYASVVAFNLVNTAWVGSTTAVVTELVLPRMRAIATAILLLLYTFVGLALGPFAVGRISDMLVAGGSSESDALGRALGYALSALIVCAVFLARAMGSIESDETSVAERARLAGEPT
jgi:MFS family permease